MIKYVGTSFWKIVREKIIAPFLCRYKNWNADFKRWHQCEKHRVGKPVSIYVYSSKYCTWNYYQKPMNWTEAYSNDSGSFLWTCFFVARSERTAKRTFKCVLFLQDKPSAHKSLLAFRKWTKFTLEVIDQYSNILMVKLSRTISNLRWVFRKLKKYLQRCKSHSYEEIISADVEDWLAYHDKEFSEGL